MSYRERKNAFQLSILPTNLTVYQNQTTPTAFIMDYGLDGSINRTDIFSDRTEIVRSITMPQNPYDVYPVVRDMTGNYIMHVDLKLSEVGYKNQTLHAMAYQDMNSQWVNTRHLDNETMYFAIYADAPNNFKVALYTEESF